MPRETRVEIATDRAGWKYVVKQDPKSVVSQEKITGKMSGRLKVGPCRLSFQTHPWTKFRAGMASSSRVHSAVPVIDSDCGPSYERE